MDVCAFVGVAPRGPARMPFTDEDWLESGLDPDRLRGSLDASTLRRPGAAAPPSVAVPVDSWDDYTRLFGAFEGPGRLPYAVARSSTRAAGARTSCASSTTTADGSDGANGDAARLDGFAVDGHVRRSSSAPGTRAAGATRLRRRSRSRRARWRSWPRAPTRARAAGGGRPAARDARSGCGFAGGTARAADRRRRRRATGSRPRRRSGDAAARLTAGGRRRSSAESSTASLEVDDGDGRARAARRSRRSAACTRGGSPLSSAPASELVYPRRASGRTTDARAGRRGAAPSRSRPCSHAFGRDDATATLVPDDFFDRGLGARRRGAGGRRARARRRIDDVVARRGVPDLYSAGAAAAHRRGSSTRPSLAGPDFEPCVDAGDAAAAGAAAAGARRAAARPARPGRARADRRAPAAAGRARGPARSRSSSCSTCRPGSTSGGSSRGARTSTRVVRGRLPPVARRRAAATTSATRRSAQPVGVRGRHHRAARARARRAVRAGERDRRSASSTSPTRVARAPRRAAPGRDQRLPAPSATASRLTAARTLSRDPSYRQLSVRRLMTMLGARSSSEMQWVVFEPNNASLRADLRHLLRTYLRRLYRANAFAGATEDEAFFVRCDDDAEHAARCSTPGQLIARDRRRAGGAARVHRRAAHARRRRNAASRRRAG